ncbi:hypothetical protein AB3X52_08130 [Nocardioides sp. DS6]|uniref:Glycosyltransferase RgtA/B/C/D-like domain-containing protein n=1 Tax=Nocardioides eburneus TaxID=3231482 RepID=A0ABV3SXB6_9ACTN
MTAVLEKESVAAVSRPRRSRADLLLLVLVASHLVLAWVMWTRVQERTPIGDEKYYLDAARALSNLVRDLVSLHAPHGAELRDNVVGNGWFMPGTPLLMTPLLLVLPHADIGQVRLYVSVVTTLLLIAALLDVRRVLGPWYAVVVAVIPGLIPMWVLFGATMYGDMPAGILLVLLVTRLVAVVRGLAAGHVPTLRQGALLGLVAVGSLYVRGSTMPLLAGMAAAALLAVLWLLRGRTRRGERRRALGALALSAVVFVALLLPWSIGASHALGGRVVTTTSVPLGLGNTFGDPTLMCYGPCDPDSTMWFGPVRYSREVARATGHSEVEVQGQMASYALRGLTPHRYADQVVTDFENYLREPAGYAEVLHGPHDAAVGQLTFITRVTGWLFWPVILGGVAVLLLVTRRSYDAQLLSIGLKLFLGGLLVQPFVHVAGSRYWPTAAPAAGLGLALVLGLAARARGRAGERGDRPASRVLTWVQGLLTAGVALVAAALALLNA